MPNLLEYKCAKNYQNRALFDEGTAKIKWCSFFTQSVVTDKLIMKQYQTEYNKRMKYMFTGQYLTPKQLLLFLLSNSTYCAYVCLCLSACCGLFQSQRCPVDPTDCVNRPCTTHISTALTTLSKNSEDLSEI